MKNIEATKIAEALRSADTWDMDLARELCALAGMAEAFDAADGDTLPHKEEIKALGYKWRIAGEYACRLYTFDRGARRWVKTVSQEAVYDEIERAKAIGAAIDSAIFARLED